MRTRRRPRRAAPAAPPLRPAGPDLYHCGDKPEELYDLPEDPLEKNNLAEEASAEKLDRQREELPGWRAKVDAVYERY